MKTVPSYLLAQIIVVIKMEHILGIEKKLSYTHLYFSFKKLSPDKIVNCFSMFNH